MHFPHDGETLEQLADLFRILQILDIDAFFDERGLLVDIGRRKCVGQVERCAEYLRKRVVGEEIEAGFYCRRLALEIKGKPDAVIVVARFLFQRLARVFTDDT
ncbi:hypothetical protein D3C86_1809320 [compost metagenome]